MISEDAYPHADSDVSAWCHELISGASETSFHVLSITGNQPVDETPAMPPNVAAVHTVAVWEDGPPPPRGGRRWDRHAAMAARHGFILLCRGMLGDSPHHTALFRDGLRKLAKLATPHIHPLSGVPVERLLADAWRVARAEPAPDGDGKEPGDPWRDADTDVAGIEAIRTALPQLGPDEEEHAAAVLTHILSLLTSRAPGTDVCHVLDAGLSGMVALAAKWRHGIPYLLTEHSVYLRERYLEAADEMPAATRAAMLGFFTALARVIYAEAALIAPVSAAFRRWELRYGAHPACVVPVTPIADPATYALLYADVRSSRVRAHAARASNHAYVSDLATYRGPTTQLAGPPQPAAA